MTMTKEALLGCPEKRIFNNNKKFIILQGLRVAQAAVTERWP